MVEPDKDTIRDLCEEIRSHWPDGIPHGQRLPCKLTRIWYGYDLPRRYRLAGRHTPCHGVPQPLREDT